MRKGVLGLAVVLAFAGCAARNATPLLPHQVGGPQSSAVRSRAAAPVGVVVDARAPGATVSADAYGGSLDTWYDFNRRFVAPSLQRSGMHLVRFPGGSESDVYHWENGGSLCDSKQGYVWPGATFANLVRNVLRPTGFDLAVTLNYGSNRQCNGGGDPSEAGAWVAYAKRLGVSGAHWTVGNEVYGSWEYDLHAKPHDPTTYAEAVRTGYYPAVKVADPSARLGVVVNTPDDTAWNDVVLREAWPFDFVELHDYPENQAANDAFLLGDGVARFARDLKRLRVEMTADGVPTSVPIYLGEYNADSGTPGKQSVSIVNGLFLGQMLGTLLDAGVPMATWWVDYGGCAQGGGDYAPTLYGWQHFGSYALFSDGLPYPAGGCPHTAVIPGGTPFPTGRVMSLFAHAVPAGARVLATSVTPGRGVRAYGFAAGHGYALVLFNNTLAPVAVVARVRNAGNAFVATERVYGAAQYDRSRENSWVGPLTRALGTVSARMALTLPSYSATALELRER